MSSAENEFYVPLEVGEKAYRGTTFKDLLNEIEEARKSDNARRLRSRQTARQ